MVVDTFFNLLRKKSLLAQSFDISREMFDLNEKMFQIAVEGIEKREPCKAKIKEIDREVNQKEITIRKKVLEHLSFSENQDITSSLVVLGVAKDLERMGDFSKNIADITEQISENHTLEKIEFGEYKKYLIEMFSLTREAFSDDNEAKAKKVIKMHKNKKSEFNTRISELIKSEEVTRETLVSILLLRYFKRYSSHLSSIASSVVNPFDLIGFVARSVDLES